MRSCASSRTSSDFEINSIQSVDRVVFVVLLHLWLMPFLFRSTSRLLTITRPKTHANTSLFNQQVQTTTCDGCNILSQSNPPDLTSANSPTIMELQQQQGTNKKKRKRTWNECYEELHSFHSVEGHCKVREAKLEAWAGYQRKHRAKLSDHQIEKLDAINFDWESLSTKNERHWNEMFQLLKRYNVEHGHAVVPVAEKYHGKPLGTWVSNQRSVYKKQKLRQDRKELLESINFQWIADERFCWKDGRSTTKNDEIWNAKFKTLCEFKQQYSHTMVLGNHMVTSDYDGENFDLGRWVGDQRQSFREDRIRMDRRKKLESIDFVFEIDETNAAASNSQRQWEEYYDRLVQYKDASGHCNVPHRYDKDPTLGSWVHRQRNEQSGGKLHPKRFQRLNELGFCWDQKQDWWDTMFQHLASFQKSTGHCRVPQDFKTNDSTNLGQWVSRVRESKASNTLTEERAARLDNLGFVWNALDYQWETMVEKLEEYKRENGHCRVPQKYVTIDGAKLGSWVSTAREKKDTTMPPERVEQLEKLGFVWDTPQYQWDLSFKKLRKYKKRYGDCLVPQRYIDKKGFQLGVWVANLRNAKKGRRFDRILNAEKIAKLDQLGFVWDVLDHFWDAMFEQLKEYKDREGDCRVPQTYQTKTGERLGAWVNRMRQMRRGKLKTTCLTSNRIKKLDKLGFVWNPPRGPIRG